MAQKWVPKKPNFGPPPPGYIAGLGRGATGFVTRSDLGPAARAANVLKVQSSQMDEAAYADNKFDSWSGYKGALFTAQQVDEQDKQADEAFDFCQRRMEERRLKEKERKMQQQLEKQKKQRKNINNMPISQQFTDLKRQLAKVTQQQWLNLPQSLDLSIKKRKRDKYTPVPDSMIVSYLSSNTNKTEVQAITDSNQDFRQAKQALLKSNLQKAENAAGQRQSVDRIGYLTHLDTTRIDQEMLGDIKRARVLHKAALKANPKNADIWLSAARIQEIDGKLQECRNVLYKALENCITNEDIWLQLSRVQKPQQSKNILIEGLRNLPTSQKLWLALARKQEGNKEMKSKVLRRGLQSISDSTKLWKQLIELEDIDQAKSLLYKAVQCLPKQIDLWIGLAKLQKYENAKQILNKARKANPLNLAIWISAAKLQQTQSHNHEKTVNKIQQIVTKGREILKKNGNTISRQQLLQQALICQRSGNLLTCESIVKSVISLGLTEDELNHSIFKDVDLYEKQYDSVYTTRFLFRYGVQLTKNIRLLEKMLQFQQRLAINDLRESNQNKKSKVVQSLQFGLKVFPDYAQFWLTMINRLIQHKNYEQATEVIQNALKNINQQQKQKLFLKNIQILKRTNKIEQARKQLKELRQKYPDSMLSAIQSIWFQYHIQNFTEAWKICNELFKRNIKNQQIWELALRIKRKIGSYEQCKNLAEKAVAQNPKNIKLWRLYFQIQLQNRFESKARTIIDKALMKNPKNEQLYLLLINLQIKTANKKQISTTLAKALKECPKCGQIWAVAILFQPHNTRKKKASIAIEQCGTDPAISCAVAKLFWKDNKIDKARKWLEDAIQMDKLNGDLWAYYYKIIIQNFPGEQQKVLTQFQQVGKITNGRKWTKIKQDTANGWKLNQKQILQKIVKEIGDQIYQIQ